MAGFIERPAVSGTGAIRSRIFQRHADQQRAVEPAAKLIAALEIQVRRPGQLIFRCERRQMAGARSRTKRPECRSPCGRMFRRIFRICIRSGQFSGGFRIPDIGGVLAEQFNHAVENLPVGHRLLACLAIKYDDRHAPHALARNTPIRSCRDHVGDALLAPGRSPLNRADRLQRPLAQMIAIHSDEPLLGGSKNGRMMAAPAVRVTVVDLLRCRERSGMLQQFEHQWDSLPRRSCRSDSSGRRPSAPSALIKTPARHPQGSRPEGRWRGRFRSPPDHDQGRCAPRRSPVPK